MTSLAEREGLRGKVQMIYFDPPYGIKFGSNWQVSTRERDVRDGKAEHATRQPEQVQAFRDTWHDGIHSYLSYLRDRLTAARELLTDTGSIFVQIGDENVHLVRCALDEVLGSANFVATISFAKTSGFSGRYLSSICDMILWYAKSLQAIKYRALYQEKQAGQEGASKYREASTYAAVDRVVFAGTRPAPSPDQTSQGASQALDQAFTFHGRSWYPPAGLHWKTTVQGMHRLVRAQRVMVEGESPRYVRFLDDFPVSTLNNIWLDVGGIQSRSDPKVYVVQTANEAVRRCMLMSTDPGDLVLDPTCGSGTTAYVAEQWGRRWITIDTSRVALALARTRLMSATYPYYILADSPEGLTREAALSGTTPPAPLPPTAGDVRRGFVYRRVPHIMLKDIANNEEIDVIHARWQGTLEPLRERLNNARGEHWEEWQVPHEAGDDWPAADRALLAEWWTARRARQGEIDDSIARHATQEVLVDQPYEDRNRIRVAGPFTVESLSPHRVLGTGLSLPRAERDARRGEGPNQFALMILDNLRTAGVQNRVKQERIKFERLEPYAGTWLHGEGEYTDAEGKNVRVAVHIGPEHGTVGPDDVKQAALEAVQGLGHDVLIVCGFAFDPQVGEETRKYGRLVVLPTRMNPDLTMGDELLKKTGAGNLFMVFGEPDIDIRRQDDGRFVVRLKGVDVYDPTTGQIRSNSTADIACWFIDTDYNGESFLVRHAYFTGADRPYERLQRALRAEVNEEAWASLYATESYPFEAPASGRIAVKVINHYGDEVLVVRDVWGRR